MCGFDSHMLYPLSACDPGTFGSDCLRTCNCNAAAEDNVCDTQSGDCGDLGCAPGYTGLDCWTPDTSYSSKIVRMQIQHE